MLSKISLIWREKYDNTAIVLESAASKASHSPGRFTYSHDPERYAE